MLLARAENQRVADLAAYAGATAFARERSVSDMEEAALHVAVLNGETRSDVTVLLVSSPVDADRDAVEVRVAAQADLILAPLVGLGDRLNSVAVAIADLSRGTGLCVAALDPAGPGIVM